MSDTNLKAIISADATKLSSALNESVKTILQSSNKMSKSIGKIGESLDMVSKSAAKASEALASIKEKESSSGATGGFISNLTSKLGIANSSMQDVLKQLVGVGSQAELIMKGIESAGVIVKHFYDRINADAQENTDILLRNADSMREVSQEMQRNREATTDAMRQLGELASTEKLSNVQKQQQIELLAKLSHGYADLAEKMTDAEGNLVNFDEAMVEKLKRDKNRQLQEIEAELGNLKSAKEIQDKLIESEGRFYNLIINKGDEKVTQASERSQEIADRIFQLLKKRHEISSSDEAGVYQRRAEARKKDREERQRATEAGTVSQMSDELAVAGMSQFDRRRFDLGKKVERMSGDIISEDGRRKLEEYRRNVLAQIQKDEEAERRAIEERRKATEAGAIGQMSDELAVAGMSQFDRRRFDLGKKVERMSGDIISEEGRRKLEEYRSSVLAQIQKDEETERRRIEEQALQERIRLEEEAKRNRLRQMEEAERRHLDAYKKMLDAEGKLGNLQDRMAEERTRELAEKNIESLQQELDALSEQESQSRSEYGFDARDAIRLMSESNVDRFRRRRDRRTAESIQDKIARGNAGEKVRFTKREKAMIKEQREIQKAQEEKKRQLQEARDAEARRQQEMAMQAAEKQMSAAEEEAAAARELAESARLLRYDDETDAGAAAEEGAAPGEASSSQAEGKSEAETGADSSAGQAASDAAPVAAFAPSPLARGAAGASAAATGPSAIGQQLSAIQAILQQMSTKFYFVQG